MKNTIARYFSVDEGIRDSRGESRYRSIFVKNFREKNGEKQKILQSWKIIKLLNYQIQQKKVIEIFQVGDNLKQRIKDDTNWKMIQIVRKSRIKSERKNWGQGFWRTRSSEIFRAIGLSGDEFEVCRAKGWQWYFEIVLRSMLDRLRNYNWISQ